MNKMSVHNTSAADERAQRECVALFVIILKRQLDLKTARLKLEGAALRCKRNGWKLRILVIRDELEDCPGFMEFKMEKIARWLGWIYGIKVEITEDSSAVPLLRAARVIRTGNYAAVFCMSPRSRIASLLPRQLRAEITTLLNCECGKEKLEILQV